MKNIDRTKLSEDFVQRILKKVNFNDEEDYDDELSRQTYLYIAKHEFDIPLAIDILLTFYKYLKTTVDKYLYESIITSIILFKTKDKKLSSLLLQLFENEYEIDRLKKENDFIKNQLVKYGRMLG